MGYGHLVTEANRDCLWSSQRNAFVKIEIIIVQTFKSLEIRTKYHLNIKDEVQAQF